MFPPLTWRGREELASAPPPRVEDRNTANRGAVKPVWTTDGVFGRLKRTTVSLPYNTWWFLDPRCLRHFSDPSGLDFVLDQPSLGLEPYYT